MNNLYFIISALLVASTAFTADNADRSTIDKKGTLNLVLRPLCCDDAHEIKTLSNCFIDRIGQPAMQHMYIQDLMKIPSAYNVMYLATLDMANQDPACAESMLTNFIPKNNNAISFAILATMIAEAYRDKQQYDDAARLFITSWQIKPTQTLASKILAMQAKKQEHRGILFWYAKAQKEDCPPIDIHPDMIKIIGGGINAEPGQKTDFNKDVEEILNNETSEVGDLYNPDYLLFREDM